MSASLRARLDKLERQQSGRTRPRLVFGLRGAEDADVIAYDGNGIVTLRGDNEPLAELQERAFAMSGAIVLTARYREEARQALAELEEGPPPTAMASDASEAPQEAPSPVDAYWGRAGVGISREAWRRFRRDGDTSFD